MEQTAQHWHVAVAYPGYPDGDEELAFRHLDHALDYAAQTQDMFRRDGHTVTEVETPSDDRTGVVQRYHVVDQPGGTPVALIEVRACHEPGHV